LNDVCVLFGTDVLLPTVHDGVMEKSPSSGLMIPGERERNTLTYRQPGSIGGPEFGSEVISRANPRIDAVTIADTNAKAEARQIRAGFDDAA
jgi:hypothetical protein